MTSISVALATWNGARFLREQLASYTRQTILPTELVVSDDASTDATQEILEEFAKVAPFPVKIVARGEHLGFADNFFRATKACSGQFIAFSDQDDVWLPAKLETAMIRLQRDQSCLALHTSTLTDERLNPYGVLKQGICGSRIYEPLQLDPYVGLGWGNTMMFDRRLLELVPLEWRPKQPEAESRLLSHDTWMYVLAAALGRVSHIDQPLCLYRQHHGNAFGSKKLSLAERLLATTQVPLYRHRCRIEFYQAVEQIFDRLQSSSDLDLAKAARRAAARYRGRWERLESRLRIYTGHKASVRLGEFLKALKMPLDDPSTDQRLLSRVKDLLLGVCGFGTVLRQPSPNG